MIKPRFGGVFLCINSGDKKIGRAYGNSANVMFANKISMEICNPILSI
jgi:hypothetical protein